MARLRLAAPITLLTLTLAGCGGANVVVEDAPGPPAQLTVPGTAEAFAPQATATATVSATPTPTSTTTGTSTTPSTSGTGTGTTSGGTTAPSTGTDSATNDTPPPAGSNAQQFEDFCAQNPGAC